MPVFRRVFDFCGAKAENIPLVFEEDKAKLESMLADFSVYNACGVNAAKELFEDGWFDNKAPDQYSIECIFNELSKLISN